MLKRMQLARASRNEETAIYTRLFTDAACALALTGLVAVIVLAGVEDRHAVSVWLVLCAILVS